MNKLKPSDVGTLISANADLTSLFLELEQAKDEFEARCVAIIEKIDEAKEEARSVLDDAALEAEDYYDQRSEKWMESDRGQAYDEWKNRLRELADAAAEDVEPPSVEMADIPDWVNDLAECDFSEFEYND